MLTDKVASSIAESGPEIEAAAINVMKAKVIKERTSILVSATEAAESLRAKLDKIKPDVVAYNEGGQVVSANWSKSKLDERNKLQATLDKGEKLFGEALNANTDDAYAALNKWVSSSSQSNS